MDKPQPQPVTSPKWYFVISSYLLLYGEEKEEKGRWRGEKREKEREEIARSLLAKSEASLNPHST